MIFLTQLNYTCNYYWVLSGYFLFTERTGRQGIWSLYRPFSGKQRTGSDSPSSLLVGFFRNSTTGLDTCATGVDTCTTGLDT